MGVIVRPEINNFKPIFGTGRLNHFSHRNRSLIEWWILNEYNQAAYLWGQRGIKLTTYHSPTWGYNYKLGHGMQFVAASTQYCGVDFTSKTWTLPITIICSFVCTNPTSAANQTPFSSATAASTGWAIRVSATAGKLEYLIPGSLERDLGFAALSANVPYTVVITHGPAATTLDSYLYNHATGVVSVSNLTNCVALTASSAFLIGGLGNASDANSTDYWGGTVHRCEFYEFRAFTKQEAIHAIYFPFGTSDASRLLFSPKSAGSYISQEWSGWIYDIDQHL